MKLNYLLIFITGIFALSLQDAYNESSSFNHYDKYVVLDSNTIYTGGLGIYEGFVYINCKCKSRAATGGVQD